MIMISHVYVNIESCAYALQSVCVVRVYFRAFVYYSIFSVVWKISTHLWSHLFHISRCIQTDNNKKNS